MLITTAGDFQFIIKSKDHQVICDQPDRRNKGMTPPELFLGALGSCIGVYIENYCHQIKIPIDGMTINIDWEKASEPTRIGEIEVKVNIPNGQAGKRIQAIQRAAEKCLIHNTLRNTPTVKIDIKTS